MPDAEGNTHGNTHARSLNVTCYKRAANVLITRLIATALGRRHLGKKNKHSNKQNRLINSTALWRLQLTKKMTIIMS